MVELSRLEYKREWQRRKRAEDKAAREAAKVRVLVDSPPQQSPTEFVGTVHIEDDKVRFHAAQEQSTVALTPINAAWQALSPETRAEIERRTTIAFKAHEKPPEPSPPPPRPVDPLQAAMMVWREAGHDPNRILAEIGRRMAPPPPDPMQQVEAKLSIFRNDPRNEFLPLVESAMRERLLNDPNEPVYVAYNRCCSDAPLVQEILDLRNRSVRTEYSRGLNPVQRAHNAAKASIGGAPSVKPRPERREDSRGDPGGFNDHMQTVRAAYNKVRGD